MCFPLDARTLTHVHRVEVIQEGPRCPGTSLSAPSPRDCTFRSQQRRGTVPHGDQRNAEENVTWLHSYVSDDKRRTFCVYDAPSPEAIRKANGRNDLPVDRITPVQVLDPYFYK